MENIVSQGEIARFDQFLVLSQCFQKSSDADASIGGKGLKIMKNVNYRKLSDLLNCLVLN